MDINVPCMSFVTLVFQVVLPKKVKIVSLNLHFEEMKEIGSQVLHAYITNGGTIVFNL